MIFALAAASNTAFGSPVPNDGNGIWFLLSAHVPRAHCYLCVDHLFYLLAVHSKWLAVDPNSSDRRNANEAYRNRSRDKKKQ